MMRCPLPLPVALALSLLPIASLQAQESATPQAAAGSSPVVIEAEDYAFDAPDEIPSGWTNIRYVNTGDEPHLLFMARLPEGKGREDYELEVIAPFDAGWQQLRAGEIGAEEAMGVIEGDLPEWFADIDFMGGTGVVLEGEAAEVTLELDPGTYVIECYMKTDEGEFHTMEGMVRELVVDETLSTTLPPRADAEITLSNFEMDIEGDLAPGQQTIAVHVEEHPAEGFGHNVHVARDEEAEPEEVLRWLNFLEMDGMAPPAPFHFLGGVHVMQEGATGYFTVDLEPGRYLLLSEYTGVEGVLREIRVDP